MNISSAFPSKYIKAADLDGRDWTLTIKAASLEEMEQSGETKPVLYFNETERGLVLNRTNADTIATKLGDDTDAWSGMSVVLFSATTNYAGRTVPCIRVRLDTSAVPPVSTAPQGPSDDVPF